MTMVPVRPGTTENPVKMGTPVRVGGRRSSKVRENPDFKIGIKRRLYQAGMRLAMVLNEVFRGD
jgi:hypothetical protein